MIYNKKPIFGKFLDILIDAEYLSEDVENTESEENYEDEFPNLSIEEIDSIIHRMDKKIDYEEAASLYNNVVDFESKSYIIKNGHLKKSSSSKNELMCLSIEDDGGVFEVIVTPDTFYLEIFHKNDEICVIGKYFDDDYVASIICRPNQLKRFDCSNNLVGISFK